MSFSASSIPLTSSGVNESIALETSLGLKPKYRSDAVVGLLK